MPYLMNCLMSIAKDLWDELIGRYLIEDEGTKKFAASNFLHFQMTDEKNITSQIHEFHNVVAELAKEGDGLPESFVTQCHNLIEDEGTKKFAASNFLHFQMTDEKSITSQIHEFHSIVAELAKEGDGLPESFVTQCLAEKLSDSWKEYKLHFKQKKTFMRLQQTIIHIKIEERNRSLEKVNKAGNYF
jgi:hypothetical protein